MDERSSSPLRIAIHSDRRLIRDVLAAYLDGRPEFYVVGKTATTKCLHALCAVRAPQLAVIDAGRFTLPLVEELRILRGSYPTVGLVVVYAELLPQTLEATVRAGITDLVSSAGGLPGLLRVLRRRAGAGSPRTPGGSTLTDRELTVVSLLSAGLTAPAIARLLRISSHTVENHKRHIYAKLGVGTKSHAVSWATSLGLLDLRTAELTPGVTPPDLTNREQQILNSIAHGHTIRQTARALGIAAKTVENTQARLFRKLGTHNRAETLATAYHLGLIDFNAIEPGGSDPGVGQPAATAPRQREAPVDRGTG